MHIRMLCATRKETYDILSPANNNPKIWIKRIRIDASRKINRKLITREFIQRIIHSSRRIVILKKKNRRDRPLPPRYPNFRNGNTRIVRAIPFRITCTLLSCRAYYILFFSFCFTEFICVSYPSANVFARVANEAQFQHGEREALLIANLIATVHLKIELRLLERRFNVELER